MPKKATKADYIKLQGGKPEVRQDKESGLWHIKHEYREGEPEVVTHISPKERGTVILNGIEYETSCVWKFEGEPCEIESRKVGGESYERKA